MLEKRTYGSKLVSGLMDIIISLGRRGVIIRTVFARSTKPDGIRLLRHIGFTELLSTTEKKNFMIDIEKSGIKAIMQYKQALRESGMYTFPQTLNELLDELPLMEIEGNTTEEGTSTFSRANQEDIPACVKLSQETFQGLPQGIATIKTRLGWMEKNPDLFYVVKHNGEVVGYTATIPMQPEKIYKILANEEHMKDVRPDEIQEFKPGNPLHVYLMTMVTKPSISKAKKRAYGSTLIRGLIGTIIDLGKRGVTIETLYGRSETVDGIRALRRMGFTQIPTVTDMKNFVLKVDESDSPLIQEYKRTLKESGQAVPEKVLLPDLSPDRNDKRFDRNKGEQNRTVTNASKQRQSAQQAKQ
jgi:hypothetical protein